MGLPAYVQDLNGKYVDYNVLETGSLVRFESLQSPFVFDKNACVLYMYDKKTFSQGTTSIFNGMTWNIEEADFREDPKLGLWFGVAENSVKCTTNSFVDINNAFHLTITKQDTNGIIITELIKEIDKPLKRNMNYKHFDNAKLTSKFGFSEEFFLSGIDKIIIDDVEIDPLKFTGNRSFDRTQLAFNDLVFIKGNDVFRYDLTQGFADLSFVDIENIGGVIKVTAKFRENSNIILRDREITNDPTFGYTSGTEYRVSTGTGAGTSCDAPVSTGTSFRLVKPVSTGTGVACQIVSVEWDTTSIPDSATVTDTNIQFTPSGHINALNCDYNEMSLQPSTLGHADMWLDILNGTNYVDNSASCATASLQTVDLGASADSDVEALLTSDWFGVGIPWDDMVRDLGFHRFDLNDVQLEVVYTTGSTAHTWDITDGLGLDDTLSVTAGLTWDITDGLGLDDTLSVTAGLTWDITDGLGLDDDVVFASSDFTITDGLGLDDSVEFVLTKQKLNALMLYLNTPTSVRLGGVFAFTCPAGEFIHGITVNGTVLCSVP